MSTYFETINLNGSILFLIELMFRYAITRPFLFLILIFFRMSTVFNSQESVSGIFHLRFHGRMIRGFHLLHLN